MFLSRHLGVSEHFHTLQLPECQITPCSSSREFWSLSYWNGSRTYNHLVHQGTLIHLSKLVKRLSCLLSFYLYGPFDCMFLSCHVCISEWIHTLQLPDCEGTGCSKQVQKLNFKWLELNWNPQPITLKTNTQPFRQTIQMIDLRCEYLPVRGIWYIFLSFEGRHSDRIHTL